MHLSAIESMQLQLRWATQPLGLRWGFETISKLDITYEEEEL
jgi:hypothetical protein